MSEPLFGEALTAKPRETASDIAADALFEGVLSGAIPPGVPLRLMELSNRLNMSAMPIREALRKLDALGIVELRPHRGAWVRPLTHADLIDTYLTRLSLEPLAIAQAAERFGDSDAQRARTALADQQRLKEAGNHVDARMAHERFHFTIYEASRSTWLVRSILPAWRNSERYRVATMSTAVATRDAHKEHLQLLEAMIAHDAAGATDALIAHLANSLLSGLEAVSETDGELRGPTGEETAQIDSLRKRLSGATTSMASALTDAARGLDEHT